MKHLVSITDITSEQMQEIFNLASKFEKFQYPDLLKNKIAATLFFEPSTRTRLSFETAMERLGGKIIGFTSATSSSVSKGETLKDTILTVANYSDIIILRHPLEGSARYAAEISPIPIVNAGDGANQHPSQTLLDLYSILKTQGTLNNLTITLVGDLKYGRTVHSLIMAMKNFNPTFFLIAHQKLKLPDEYKKILNQNNIEYYESEIFDPKYIKQSDIIYMTRVQKERFSDLLEYEKTKDLYQLKLDMLTNVKKNLKILHPLPRVYEIDTDIDKTPYAYYFQQAKNGVYVRQAIIVKLLNIL